MTSFMARAAQARGRPVRASAEFQRIMALPRRTEVAIPPSYFERFRRTPSGLGNLDLRPKQAQVLYELAKYGGAMASLTLGEGKTAVGLLAGAVLGAKCAVYIVPPALARQIIDVEYPKWNEHWLLPALGSALHVVKYTDLRSKDPKKHNVLERLLATLVVADEAHCLGRKSVQARRVRRYQTKYKPTRLNLSGSFMDRSIREPAPLAAEALGAGSPYPRTYQDLEAWAWAIDDSTLGNSPPGVLVALGGPGAEALRDGFRRRVAETPGFVVSTEESCGAALALRSRDLAIPAKIGKYLDDLRRLWIRPDGFELASPLEFHRCAQTLALGFYLRWAENPPAEWRAARQAWQSDLLAYVRVGRPGLDSPALVTDAAAAGQLPQLSSYTQWASLECSYEPKSEAVWLDGFAAKDAAKWAIEGPGIVWAEHPAFGEYAAEIAGLPWYGGGTHPEIDELRRLSRGGARSFFASVPAHHEGKNLQFISRALITTPPSGARRVGQTIGRVHRQGQRAERVDIDFYLHTPEYQAAMASAQRNAAWLQATAGELQKLCVGRIGW